MTKRALSALTLIMACFATGAFGCFGSYRAVPEGKPDTEKREFILSTADYVFAGKLEQFDYVPANPSDPLLNGMAESPTGETFKARLARFSVQTWWKGPGSSSVTIDTLKRFGSGDRIISTSCDYEDFRVGETYLVFARLKGKTLSTGNNLWTDPTKQSPILTLLGEGKRPKD